MHFSLKFLVLCILFLAHVAVASGQTLKTLSVEGNHSTTEISEYVLRAANLPEPIERSSIFKSLDAFEAIETGTIRAESEIGHTVFLLSVKNTQTVPIERVFTTRRHSVNRLTIFDITSEETLILADSRAAISNSETIKRFIGYGFLLTLAPGEEKLLAIYADLENTRAVPLEIWTFEDYLDDYYYQNNRYSFLLAAMLVIILINVIFFLVMRGEIYIYLAISELFFLILIAHSVNYLDVWGFARYPVFSIQIAEIAKCLFIVFMAFFARRLISDSREYFATKHVLNTVILIGLMLTTFWLIAGEFPKETRSFSRNLTWAYVCAATFIFPYIGILAVRKFGLHYVPLVIGWSGVALTGIYVFIFTMVTTGPELPRGVSLLAFTGLQEAFFVTLSLAWRILKEKDEHRAALESYSQTLEEKLQAVNYANEVAAERSLALATVRDQNAMLRSSGHDTQHAITALKSVRHRLTSNDQIDREQLSEILTEATQLLTDVSDTSRPAATMFNIDRGVVALGTLEAEAIASSLRRIFEPLFTDRSLSIKVHSTNGLKFISDRALLSRALSNFLSNSLKYTETGGVRLSMEPDDTRIKITITDTGRGIAQAMLQRLRSETADEVQPEARLDSNGQGFLLAKSLIRQLGGEVRIESALGVGTTVELLVPSLIRTDATISSKTLEAALGERTTQVSENDAAIDPAARIGISSYYSSEMRNVASKSVSILCYHPLASELIEHPLFSTLK